ncbi:hypothetical protein BCR34DRAFT_560456, partial [Clohesyomyces aquaticus]
MREPGIRGQRRLSAPLLIFGGRATLLADAGRWWFVQRRTALSPRWRPAGLRLSRAQRLCSSSRRPGALDR